MDDQTTGDQTPNTEGVLNTVAYVTGTLALLFTLGLLVWGWYNGDVWPTDPGNSVPACIPGLDHC